VSRGDTVGHGDVTKPTPVYSKSAEPLSTSRAGRGRSVNNRLPAAAPPQRADGDMKEELLRRLSYSPKAKRLPLVSVTDT
jgi:hypothetical protein